MLVEDLSRFFTVTALVIIFASDNNFLPLAVWLHKTGLFIEFRFGPLPDWSVSFVTEAGSEKEEKQDSAAV